MQTTIPNRLNGLRPLLALLDPGRYTRATLAIGIGGMVLAAIAVQLLRVPLWMASAAVLAALLPVGVIKWRDDRRRWGATVMIGGALIAAQGFHTLEHLAQWFQYHILGWPSFKSGGLISTLDAEWVHFVWNWLVLLTVMVLMRGGMRNIFAWLLLAWAGAHTFEHSYMMWRFIETQRDLALLGVTGISPQGLPGILGRDGWLATSAWTQNSFICRLPGLTTAVRLDVHFWWNIGEVVLLLPAMNVFMRRALAAERTRLQ